MKISESMKFVLKTKSQSIFSSLVKEDFKEIIKGFAGDIVSFRPKKEAIRNFSFKDSFIEIKSSVQGTAILFKEIPRRLNEGFRIFQQELMDELDKLTDQKQKTMFCMRVLAGLSKFALSSAYDVGLGDRKILGFKGNYKKVMTHAVASKLMYKTIQAFIIRFIQEVEKEISDPEELKSLQSFKDVILDDSGNAIDKFFDGVTDPNDRAFIIIDNFKNYVRTGELTDVQNSNSDSDSAT